MVDHASKKLHITQHPAFITLTTRIPYLVKTQGLCPLIFVAPHIITMGLFTSALPASQLEFSLKSSVSDSFAPITDEVSFSFYTSYLRHWWPLLRNRIFRLPHSSFPRRTTESVTEGSGRAHQAIC